MIGLHRTAVFGRTPALSGERRRVATATALATLATLAAPALLALSGYLLARASEAPPILTLTVAIVGVRLFALVRASARYGERLVSHDLALRRLTRDRIAVYSRLVPAVPGGMGTRTSTDTLDQLVADTERLQDDTVRVFVPGVAIAITITASLAVAAAILPAAAAIMGGALLVQVVLLALIEERTARQVASAQAAARADLTGEMATVLDAAPQLVAWGLGDTWAQRIATHGTRLDALVRRTTGRASAGSAVTIITAGLAAAGVLVVATRALATDDLGAALVPALALLAFGVVDASGGLSEVFASRRDVGVASSRLRATLTGIDAPAYRSDVPVDSHLVARDVSVTRGGRRILDPVDLDVAPGERIAIMGPSGVGKSTLVQVLCGLVTPDTGTVTLGGRPVEALPDQERSRWICWVPQDPHIFPTTLAGNLRIAAPFATDAELEEALRRVGGGGWLDRLPEGLLTLLGHHGERCSGGERQRVGLARAVLSAAPLVILDEPASHLPYDDALSALSAVIDAAPGRSAVLVTHRAAEAELAEHVVRLTHDQPQPKECSGARATNRDLATHDPRDGGCCGHCGQHPRRVERDGRRRQPNDDDT